MFQDESRELHAIIKRLRLEKGYTQKEVANYLGVDVSTYAHYRLELFWSWKKVFDGDSELLKENLLNCVLLIPMGLLLPITLNCKIRWWEGLLIGTAVSAVIETCQLVFCRGLFEWDDMIHNGIGCMIGCVIMGICRRCIKNH